MIVTIYVGFPPPSYTGRFFQSIVSVYINLMVYHIVFSDKKNYLGRIHNIASALNRVMGENNMYDKISIGQSNST